MICMALKIISVSATPFFSVFIRFFLLFGLFLSVYCVLCMPGALVSSLNVENGYVFI